MLPYLYYSIVIPFVVYVLPVAIICFFFYKFYVQKLPTGSGRAFFLYWKGKVVSAFISLILVLLIYGMLVWVFVLKP